MNSRKVHLIEAPAGIINIDELGFLEAYKPMGENINNSETANLLRGLDNLE